jgi:predicted ATPase
VEEATRLEKEAAAAMKLAEMERMSKASPMLILMDDAQWVAHSSMEFNAQLNERLADRPVLMIILARPEWSPHWDQTGHCSEIVLERLEPQYLNQIIKGVAGNHHISTEVMDQLAERSDGVPLYLEELTRSLVESMETSLGTTENSDGQHVPSTLLEALLSRLDALGTAKQIALTAACIGRDFSLDTLAAASQTTAEKLQPALDQLVGSDLIVQQTDKSPDLYSFRHMLVQETA